MPDDKETIIDTLDALFEDVLHLPTLITMAVVAALLVWLMYDLSFVLSSDFLRVSSNQGDVMLYWAGGCCRVLW